MAGVKQIRESAGISYNGCAVFSKSEVGGVNIWQVRITNLARNLTFAMS